MGQIHTHTHSHSPWIHMATVSSRVLNSQCKRSLVGVWHSEGSGGPSLRVQPKNKIKSTYNASHLGQYFSRLITRELYKMQKETEVFLTIANTQRFKGRTGLNCVGGVNEVQ